jgi:hypothetical protein
MTMHAPVPSDIEAEALAELIADAKLVPLPRRRVVDLSALPRQRRIIDVPDSTSALTDGYADYGAC